MIKESNYIFKRVLIGVLIALILMFIKHSLITNVSALERVEGNIIGYTYPPEKPVINEENFYWTNIWDSVNYVPGITSLNTYSRYWYDIRQKEDNTNNILDTDYTDFVNIKNANMSLYGSDTLCSLNNTWCIGGTPYVGVQKLDLFFGPLDNNNWSPGTGADPSSTTTFLKIERSKTYTMLVGIEKDSNLSYYSDSNLPITLDMRGNYYTNDSLETTGVSLTTNSTYLKTLSTEWIPPSSIENGDPNQAYFKVSFELSDYIGYSDYFYISRISFNVGTTPGENANNRTPFIFNDDSQDGDFRIYNFSFVEDGFIDIIGNGGELPNYSSLDLDTRTNYDLEVIESLKTTCEPLDVICHLKNITNFIEQIFINIRNFFTNIISFLYRLFVPNESDWSLLHESISTLATTLHNKLGILVYPFELMGTLFRIYIDALQRNDFNNVISLPVLREPFSNNIIWSGGNLDLGAIFSTGSIGTLHSLYMAFISCYIVLMFIDFLYKSFSNFIEGKVFISKKGSDKE